MYPQRELKTLALNKARLRRRLARQREQCVAAAAELAKPFEWLDRARARWQQLSPVLKIAGLLLGILARGSLFSGGRKIARWIRWGAAALGLLRGLKAMRG